MNEWSLPGQAHIVLTKGVGILKECYTNLIG